MTLIGIGMGTTDGMTAEAAGAVAASDLLIGAGRMLEAVGNPGRPVYQDYDAQRIADYIRTHPEYVRPAVLLSGDIGFTAVRRSCMRRWNKWTVRYGASAGSLLLCISAESCISPGRMYA